MINHKLNIFGGGHDPKPDLDDFEIVHIIYSLDTTEIDDESNTVVKFASTGLRAVYLKPWDLTNKTLGRDVTDEQLQSWLLEEIDLDQLKAKNVANLKALPK